MTNAPLPTPSPARRTPILVRFMVAFLVGLVAVGGLGVGALYAYEQQYAGKVLPGVRVGDVDLSGMTPAAARAALADRYGGFGAGRVVVAGPAGEMTIGYGSIGRAPALDALVAAALAAGRDPDGAGNLVGSARTALRGVSIDPAVTFDPERLAAAVIAIAEAVDHDPVEAGVEVAEDATYTVTAGANGRVVDQAALLETITGALVATDAPAELRFDLPMTDVEPVVTTAEAEAAKAAADRMVADLVFTDGEGSWTIAESSLRPLIRFARTVDGGVVPVVDVGGLDPLLGVVAKAVQQAPKNASYLIGQGGTVVGVEAGRDGRALNLEETRDLVIEALMARQDGSTPPELRPVVAAVPPALTTEEAERTAPLMRQISKWTTYFPISEKNGFGANIWIPTSIIDGYVVGPGETFDFWKAVGPVTRERGYKDGGAIINGRTEPQGALAGGICSCSTTLFNAALRAGFEMGARRNHYYYIDRYPLGLDATVFISAGGSRQTMSWTNDTAYPVLIRGINTRKGSAGYTTFALYSVPSNRVVTFSEPIVKDILKATDTVEYTSKLPAGTSQRIEHPVDGMKVWVTRTVTENGRVIHRETYYSNYARITGVTLVGTAGSSPGPTPTPAPPAPTPAPPTPTPSP